MAKKKEFPAKKFDDLPTSRRHNAIVEEIEDEAQTDRAVAIVGAAYVDLVLRDAITARLLADEKLMNELFENRGPLQDFWARVQVAFALQIIGRGAYEDFRVIKNIRNAFAHSADALDFNQQDVAQLCERLWYPKEFPFNNRPEPTTPRGLYIRAVSLLTQLMLDNLLRRKRGMQDDALLLAERTP